MTTDALHARLDELADLDVALFDEDFLLTWHHAEPTIRFLVLAADILETMARRGVSTRLFDTGLGLSIFRDKSTRTRYAFRAACNLLGLATEELDETTSQVAHGVTVREKAAMIGFLSEVVGIRDDMFSHNPRSTVGTVTEIYDYMRLLFARAGIPHCPICGREVVKQSAQEIVDRVETLPDGTRVLILSPLVRARKGTYQAVFEEVRKAGFARARVDGTVYSLDDEINLDRYKQHTIEAVVDRLVISNNGDKEERKAARTRLTDSIETALKFGEGYVSVNLVDQKEDIHFSEHLACPEHGVSISEVEPRTFSFNTPQGACPVCQGLGSKL